MEAVQEDHGSHARCQNTRTKWSMKMNLDLVSCKEKAVEVFGMEACPRKQNGRKVGIMELTKLYWEELGYGYLQKSAQNLRDQVARIKTSHNQDNKQYTKRSGNKSQTKRKTQETSRTITNEQSDETILLKPEEMFSDEFNEVNRMARNKFEEIIKAPGEWKGRDQSTFTKNLPSVEEISCLETIIVKLIKQDPIEKPAEYLWEVNCAIYSTVYAWKCVILKQEDQGNKKTFSDKKLGWMAKLEEKMNRIRGKISQISEEIKRLRTNGKLTKKLRKNSRWMKKELKSNITLNALLALKEKKVSQIITIKLKKRKKEESS